MSDTHNNDISCHNELTISCLKRWTKPVLVHTFGLSASTLTVRSAPPLAYRRLKRNWTVTWKVAGNLGLTVT